MVELGSVRKVAVKKVSEVTQDLVTCILAVSVSKLMEVVDIEHDYCCTAYAAVADNRINISRQSLRSGKPRYLMRRARLLEYILNFIHGRQIEDTSRNPSGECISVLERLTSDRYPGSFIFLIPDTNFDSKSRTDLLDRTVKYIS